MSISTFKSFSRIATFLFVLISNEIVHSQDFFEVALQGDVSNGIDREFYDIPGDGYSRIHGFIALDGVDDGIDVYKIRVTEPQNFFIRNESGMFDTKAFLFDANFTALMQNDDDPAQSLLPFTKRFGFRDGTNHLDINIGFPPAQLVDDAIYYLAIGAGGDVARDANGLDLFLPDGGVSTALVGPLNAPRQLGSWTANGAGSHIVSLSGAKMIGYSIPESNSNEFNWTGAADDLISNGANWLEGMPPPVNPVNPVTDIFFDVLSESNNSIDQDLKTLCARSVEANCADFDFTLSSAKDSPIQVEPYGKFCARGGIPSNRFNITSPISLGFDAVMVADNGEFFIDGSDGKNGTVTGVGTLDGEKTGAIFDGPNGDLTFNFVGCSPISSPMGNFSSSIRLQVKFQGDNFFAPPDSPDIPNDIFGSAIFDSTGGAGIHGGLFRFQNTFVVVNGGNVFTLDTTEQIRFSTSLVLITPGTELHCANGKIRGALAEVRVSDAATLRVGGVGFVPTIVVDDGGLLTGTGCFEGPILINGRLEPGNSAGTLILEEDLDLSETSVTCIELGGTSSKSFDQIIYGSKDKNEKPTNEFNLGGTLEVLAIDNFVPQAGDEFVIIEAAEQINGQFDKVNSNLLFDIEYGDRFVRLFNFQSGLFGATSFTIPVGSLADGDVQSTAESDDQFLSIQSEDRIRVLFDAFLSNPTVDSLNLILESHASTPNLELELEVLDLRSGVFVDVGFFTPTVFDDSTINVDLSKGITNFVNQKTGQVRCRLKYAAVGPVLTQPWKVFIDRLIWDTTQ